MISDERSGNGVRLVYLRAPGRPTTTLYGHVVAGPLVETRAEAGWSHWAEHCMFGAAAGLEGRSAVYKGLARVGEDECNTYYSRVILAQRAPAEYFDRSAELVTGILLNSSVDEDFIAAEKGIVLNEIDTGTSRPSSLAWGSTFKRLFRGTPLEKPVIGYKSSVNRGKPSDLLAFYHKVYSPDNATFVFVGDLPYERVRDAVWRATEDLSPSGIVVPELAVPGAKPSEKFLEKGTGSVFYAAAHAVPGADSRRLAMAAYADSCLELAFEKELGGLVQGSAGFFFPAPGAGMFNLAGEVRPSDVAEAREKAREFIETLSIGKGLKKSDISAVVEAKSNEMILKRESTMALAEMVHEGALYAGDPEALLRDCNPSPGEVLDFLRQELKPDALTETAAGPENPFAR